MSRTLKVESEGGEGWAIFVDRMPVIDFNKDGEAPVDLNVGEHSLTYEIRGSGGKITIDLEGRPRIILPVGGTWPFKAKVPGHSSLTSDRIYFVIGD